jgi:hypothetical protein
MSTNHTPEGHIHGETPAEVTSVSTADAHAVKQHASAAAVAEPTPNAEVAAAEPVAKPAKVKPPKAALKPSKTSLQPQPLAAESGETRVKASKKAAAPAAEVKPAAPKRAKAEPAARKPEKPAKTKLVRDSFTMPQADFDLVDVLKQRALNFRHAAKKGELLRAGLQALAALSEADLQAALERVTSLKPGRPKKAS